MLAVSDTGVGMDEETVARIFSTSSRSINRFVAKLLLTVIMASHNWRSVSVRPTAA